MTSMPFANQLEINFYRVCHNDISNLDVLLLMLNCLVLSSIGIIGCLICYEFQMKRDIDESSEIEEVEEDQPENEQEAEPRDEEPEDRPENEQETNPQDEGAKPEEAVESDNSDNENSNPYDDKGTEEEKQTEAEETENLDEIISAVRNSHHESNQKVNDPMAVQELLTAQSNNDKIGKLIDLSKKTKETLGQLATSEKKKQFISEVFTAFEDVCLKLKKTE